MPLSLNRVVTTKVVAQQPGVTQATVSMSLANYPRIAVGTRTRIQALARKLGYQPNPYVSTLLRARRQGRELTDKPTLALVGAFDTADGWREDPSVTLQQQRLGALERATLRGYRPGASWLHREGMSNERFSDMLRARGIHGVLISPLADWAPPPAPHRGYFATVSLSVPWPELPVTTVCNDHYFSSLQTARECHRRGYRRVGPRAAEDQPGATPGALARGHAGGTGHAFGHRAHGADFRGRHG
ncbi:MAG: LacI family DNA-binding transcriptional regulator [Undibacterium sp.]|nr:LacI family DNA-binding transcriptional regulator [Opitutaceae bacterium]